MITTRTRLLSILATVAMLVSMLACFIIPASADALSDYTEVLADISEGATNLSAEIAKGAEATPESLKAAAQADATAGTIVWKTFNYKSEPYPSYALREAYEAAGYDKLESNRTQWSIASPADWRKMIADSTYDANGGTLFDGTQQLLFTGVVFHLYKDVDFDNQEMAPLCYGKTGGDNEKLGTFNGTINGHGYAFKNINVVTAATATELQADGGLITGVEGQVSLLPHAVTGGGIAAVSHRLRAAVGSLDNGGSAAAAIRHVQTHGLSGGSFVAEPEFYSVIRIGSNLNVGHIAGISIGSEVIRTVQGLSAAMSRSSGQPTTADLPSGQIAALKIAVGNGNIDIRSAHGEHSQRQQGAQHGQHGQHSQNFAHVDLHIVFLLKMFLGTKYNSGEWAASVEPPVPMRVFSHHCDGKPKRRGYDYLPQRLDATPERTYSYYLSYYIKDQ